MASRTTYSRTVVAGDDENGFGEQVDALKRQYPDKYWCVYTRRSKVRRRRGDQQLAAEIAVDTLLASTGVDGKSTISAMAVDEAVRPLVWDGVIEEADDATRESRMLEMQRTLPRALYEAGVPRERIIVLPGDSGKSASLGPMYRAYYDLLRHLLLTGRMGVLATVEVSRLHRDSSGRQAPDFAAIMGMDRVKMSVLTQEGMQWSALAMHTKDAERYVALARTAAEERQTLRRRSMQSRDTAAAAAEWTGRPCPIGWVAFPTVSATDSPDGTIHRGWYEIWEPHAAVKLEIMRASLLPHVTSIEKLYDHLVLYDMRLPALPERVVSKRGLGSISRQRAVSNSAYHRCVIGDANVPGGRRRVRPDESFILPILSLETLLLESMTIGDVRMGTGEQGAYLRRRAEHIAETQTQKADTQIRVMRPLMAHAPDLAICNTPELEELYWEVVKKWSRVDLKAARAKLYEEEPLNLDRIEAKRGRPAGGVLELNPFAGRVWCYAHGLDDNGDFRRVRHMSTGGKHNLCAYNQRSGLEESSCRSISDVGSLLERHLLSVVGALLDEGSEAISRLEDERNATKRRVTAIQRDLEMLRQRQADVSRTLIALQGGWAAFGEDFAVAESERWVKENVSPVASELKAKQRELAVAEGASLTTAVTTTASEVRESLHSAVAQWGQLTPMRRREIVATFVSDVGVLVPLRGGAVLIEIEYNPQFILRADGAPVVDILIIYKNEWQDRRPFTSDEDDALRRLWPVESGADRDDIMTALLPGRNYHKIDRHVTKLGIKGNRTNAWRRAWMESTHTWAERNPDVAYLQVEGFGSMVSFLRTVASLDATRDEWSRHSITARFNRVGVDAEREQVQELNETSDNIPSGPARGVSILAAAEAMSDLMVWPVRKARGKPRPAPTRLRASMERGSLPDEVLSDVAKLAREVGIKYHPPNSEKALSPRITSVKATTGRTATTKPVRQFFKTTSRTIKGCTGFCAMTSAFPKPCEKTRKNGGCPATSLSRRAAGRINSMCARGGAWSANS